ncbi:MAG: CHAT domain-containing protein [Methylobacter sp.]
MEQKTTKILIVAANPLDTERLGLDEEYREIKEILRTSGRKSHFDLEYAPAANVDDLRQRLLDFDPHIVHFSGHGELQGLYFQNEQNSAQLIRKEALEHLFALFKNTINCIVLNACYSEDLAKAFANHIERVIGMDSPIGDEAAIKFAKGFYQALFYGRDVDFSFEFGKSAIETANLEDWQVPQLKKRAQNPAPALPRQAYLKHYADDVLIHAATDDLSFAEAFNIELQKHLGAKLGGLNKFHLRLQTNRDDFSQTAAIVIVLLSKNYLQQYGDNFQTLPQLQQKHLLLVELDNTQKPESLAEIMGYSFWQQIRQNTLTYQTTDSVYQLSIAELIIELDGLLQQLKNWQDPSNNITVFINVAPEDRGLGKEVQKLLAQLFGLASALPATTGTRTDIGNKFQSCQAVLFIYVQGSDEWMDNQLLACAQALSEYKKEFKIIAIHTNEQQIDRINVSLPQLNLQPYFSPPESLNAYLSRFVEALQ